MLDLPAVAPSPPTIAPFAAAEPVAPPSVAAEAPEPSASHDWIGYTLLGVGAAGWAWGSELRSVVDEVMAWLRAAGPGVFFSAMAVLPLLGFPLAPFTLAAGPVFGPQLGVATVIACALCAVTHH